MLLKVIPTERYVRMFEKSNWWLYCWLMIVIVDFEHSFTPCSSVSTVNFEHVITGWGKRFAVQTLLSLLESVTLSEPRARHHPNLHQSFPKFLLTLDLMYNRKKSKPVIETQAKFIRTGILVFILQYRPSHNLC